MREAESVRLRRIAEVERTGTPIYRETRVSKTATGLCNENAPPLPAIPPKTVRTKAVKLPPLAVEAEIHAVEPLLSPEDVRERIEPILIPAAPHTATTTTTTTTMATTAITSAAAAAAAAAASVTS